jgi:hypothetical protein
VILVGGAAFTFIDWRQTKHLCLLVALASLLVGRLVASVPPPARTGLRGLLLVGIAWNVWWILRLAGDFDSMVMSTIW